MGPGSSGDFRGNRETCPECHQMADILDGRYAGVSGAVLAKLEEGPARTFAVYDMLLAALRDARLTVSQLKQVHQSVSEVATQGGDDQQVIRAVEKVHQRLARQIADEFRKAPIMTTIGLAGVLKAVVELYLGAQGHPVSPPAPVHHHHHYIQGPVVETPLDRRSTPPGPQPTGADDPPEAEATPGQ